MNRYFRVTLVVLCILLLPLLFMSCPSDDDDDDCMNVEGEWDFSVVELWDCDGSAENEPEEHELIVTQLDCEISFTGTFRKNLSDIITGYINGSVITIEFYDDEAGCTLKINATVNQAGDQMTGTWEDDCYDSADSCYGESGSFTAQKEQDF
ncbi:hypothetical protein ACFL27_22300 [candidate division CSSED10-310 bacterium]|uniref:Lipocalin-like domain-containing protein n=1 Tax=candidate division CSSED10-310 bacterium TaxID=2855610 RepID=A0ABV6Z3B3_UNCC1